MNSCSYRKSDKTGMSNLHSHSLVQDVAVVPADADVDVVAAVVEGAVVVAAADAVVGEGGGGEEDVAAVAVGAYEVVDVAVAAAAVAVDDGVECLGPAREDQSEVLHPPVARIEVPEHNKGHRDPLVGPHIEATHPCVHNLSGKKGITIFLSHSIGQTRNRVFI